MKLVGLKLRMEVFEMEELCPYKSREIILKEYEIIHFVREKNMFILVC